MAAVFRAAVMDEIVARSLKRQRVFRDRENALELSDTEFQSLYRVNKKIFFKLLDELAGYLEPKCLQHKNVIPPDVKVSNLIFNLLSKEWS